MQCVTVKWAVLCAGSRYQLVQTSTVYTLVRSVGDTMINSTTGRRLMLFTRRQVGGVCLLECKHCIASACTLAQCAKFKQADIFSFWNPF